MAEKLTDIASPADSKTYDAGLAAKKMVEAVKSNPQGISTPKAKSNWKTGWEDCEAAKPVSSSSIAQDKAKQHSVKPNLSDRRK